MFFMFIGTYTKWTFIDFSPVQRVLLLIFLCHTVTHGTDLRRLPQRRCFELSGTGITADKLCDMGPQGTDYVP